MLLEAWPACRITRVQTRESFLSVLQAQPVDVILSDLTLPTFGGMDALAAACGFDPVIPFLFLSGAVGEETVVDALLHGAADFVFKERHARLISAIESALLRADRRRAQLPAEQMLREQSGILNRLPDAICVTDAHGHVIHTNPSARALFGINENDDPQSLDGLFGSHNRALLLDAVHVLHRSGAWTGELMLLPACGASKFVISRWTLIRDEEGRPKSILAVNTDVTAHRQLEVRLLRTQPTDGMDTLAARIRQDLNNILMPILTTVDLLQRRTSDPELRDLLGVVDSRARHGIALLQQIVAVERGVNGNRREVRPKDVISDLLRSVRETLTQSLRIETHIEGDLPNIRVDRDLLRQVLINLVLKARDAMDGVGVITLRVRKTDVDAALAQATPGAQSGIHVVITVSGTGKGAGPDQIDPMADPFISMSAVAQGLDQGLTTVMGIVKAQGGFLQVESTPGLGTEYCLHLPAVVHDGDEKHPSAGSRSQSRQGRGETILLINDEDGNREVMRALLEAHGYRVLAVGDARAGIKLYRERHAEVQLVLTDTMMPGVKGEDIMKEMCLINPDVRIVAMNTVLGHGEKAERTPHLAFLPKPLSGEDLLGAVRQVLTGA